MKDYYKILGVSDTATAKEITKAYRKLARESHPDANPDNEAAETRFKEISAAYDVVSDETKRKEYDGKIDFRKKKGFLESLFQTVDKSAAERKMAEKAYFDNMDVDMVGSPDSHNLEHDDFADKKDEEAPESSEPDVIELPAGDAKPTAEKPADEADKKPAESKEAAAKALKAAKAKVKAKPGKAGTTKVIAPNPESKPEPVKPGQE